MIIWKCYGCKEISTSLVDAHIHMRFHGYHYHPIELDEAEYVRSFLSIMKDNEDEA